MPKENQIQPGRWCWTSDRSRIVPETDPEAHFMYCNQHQTVDRDEFLRLGGKLEDEQKQATESLEDKDASEAVEDKAKSTKKKRGK